MREHRILFSDATWTLIQQEAERAGISTAQFIREAATAYAVWLLAGRGGNETTSEIEAIIARLRA